MKKAIHYDNGNFFIMPISGRHTMAICGRSFQDNYKPHHGRWTSDKRKATCKNCLKAIAKQ